MRSFITLTLITIVTHLIHGQYEQIKGQPCYFERFISEEQPCVAQAPDIERKSVEGSNHLSILDDNNDTILSLQYDTSGLSSSSIQEFYLEGNVSLGSNYNGKIGNYFAGLSDPFTAYSSSDIRDNTWPSISGTSLFEMYFSNFLQGFYTHTLYLTNKNTQTSFLIIFNKFSDGINKEILFDYVVLDNFKTDICPSPILELLYSDSIFYSSDGQLSKRIRNNIDGGNSFDFVSFYKYQDDGDIEFYTQIDSDGDTTQIEERFYNNNDQVYKSERSTFNLFSNSKSFYNIAYNTFGKITEIQKVTINLTTGDTTDIETETNTYDASGNWVSYVKVDQYNDTTAQQLVTQVLGNNTYKHTDIDYNFWQDRYDTTYYQTTFLDSKFNKFKPQFTTLEVFIYDKNETLLTSGINKFNSFDQFTFSEGLDHEVNPVSRFYSDSIIYDYSNNNELLERTTHRWNNEQQKYDIQSKNIYYCHGETISNPLGINNDLGLKFEVFPNPTSDLITVQTESQEINLELFSLSGQLLLNKTATQINVSNLESGVYVLKISSKGAVKSVRVVKK